MHLRRFYESAVPVVFAICGNEERPAVLVFVEDQISIGETFSSTRASCTGQDNDLKGILNLTMTHFATVRMCWVFSDKMPLLAAQKTQRGVIDLIM